MWKVGLGIGAISLFMLAHVADVDARAGGVRAGGAHFGGARGAVGVRGGMGARSFSGPAIRGGMGARSFARSAYRGGVSRRAVAGNRAFRGSRSFAGNRAFRGNRAIASQRAFRGNRSFAGNRGNLRANRALARQAGLHGRHYHGRHYHGRHFARPIVNYAWAGPLFWPYAYSDLFFYTFWPYWYDDPFWDYGYVGIYDGIFAPYGYADVPRYVGRRIARRSGVTDDTGRTQNVTGSLGQSCVAESREVTGWPIERIQRSVAPNEPQRALLDELANASIKAAESVRASCPAVQPLTPPGRLEAMEKRVEGMLKAAETVRTPLERFYNALSDEQKARFNAMGEQGDPRVTGRAARTPQPGALATCGADVPGLAWPAAQVERIVQPTDAQRANLNALAAAADEAAASIKAACPGEMPKTPVGRLDAAAKRLDALSQAVRKVHTALGTFYSALNDEQKARFNRIGDELGRRAI